MKPPKKAEAKVSAPKQRVAPGDAELVARALRGEEYTAPEPVRLPEKNMLSDPETGKPISIKDWSEKLVAKERDFKRMKQYAALGATQREREQKEKMTDANRRGAEQRGLNTKAKIKRAFEELEPQLRGRIAARSISKRTKIPVRTVREYLPAIRIEVGERQ